MPRNEPASTSELITLVQSTRQKLREAATELEELTKELRKRLEENEDE